jgi:amino-acid N-acetyltransferase
MKATDPSRAVGLRPAHPADRAAIDEVLAANRLPAAEPCVAQTRFWVAELAGQVIGTIALEHYGEQGLLRSLCVDVRVRGHGIGHALVENLETEATAAGIARLVLLTETAERFFSGLGYDAVDRATVVDAMRASPLFATACPASASCLGKTLHFQ